MKSLLPLVSLLALAAGRRHLCADLLLPICRPGPKQYPAVYRIVWRNEGDGFPDGCRPGEGPPICADGSTPQRVFNVCKNDQKQCPQGHGQDGGSKPFDACPWGKQPLCPSGKPNTCTFRNKRCPPYTKNSKRPRKQCTMGRPHCAWYTRNRNDEWTWPRTTYNDGKRRPQNRVNGHWVNPGSPPKNGGWVKAIETLQPEYRRPCAGACPCDNVHLFNATVLRWEPKYTVSSWQQCGGICKFDTDCEFWEWHKSGPHVDRCKLVSNYRKGVKQTNNDYKVVSGCKGCVSPGSSC